MRRPPSPPTNMSGLLSWAAQIVAYLSGSEEKDRTEPKPLMLARLDTNDARNKATEDGIVMYDPTQKCVVVSIDGEWRPLALQP